MQIDKEPVSPQSLTIEIIDSITDEINPDRIDMTDWFQSYVTNHKERLAFDLEMVQANIPAESSVLECGSVPLVLTGALKKVGYRVTGIDIAPERFESAIAHLGLNIKKCDIERECLPFETSSFDGVIFNELFEHLRINLIFTMREVLRVLKPGGIMLLSTPNLRSLHGIVNILVRNRGYSCDGEVFAQYDKLEKLGHMGHVREYTSRDVTDFLRRIGYDVEKLIFRGKYESPLKQSFIRLIPTLSPFVTIKARKPLQH